MLNFLKKSLRARIFALIAPALLLLAVVIVSTFTSTKSSASADKASVVELAAQSGAAAVESQLEAQRGIFSEWVNSRGETMALSIEFDLTDELATTLEEMQTGGPAYSMLALMDLEENVLAQWGGTAFEWKSGEYVMDNKDSIVEGAITAGTSIRGDEFPASGLGESSGWLFASAVSGSNGEPIAIFMASLDSAKVSDPIEATAQLLESKGIGESSVVLINADKVRTIGTSASVAGSLTTSLGELAKRGSSMPLNQIDRVDLDGRTWFVSASTPTADSNIRLLALAPESELLKGVYSQLTFNMTISLVGALMLVGLYWMLSGRISRPISVAATALADIAGSELDASKRLAVSGEDELAHLATSFNTMMVKLQAMIDEIDRGAVELKRFRPMVVNAPMPVIFVDMEDTVTYINAVAEKLVAKNRAFLDITPEEAMGSSVDVFFDSPEETKAGMKSPDTDEFEVRVNMGTNIYDFTTSAIFADGVQLGYMLVARNVTGRLRNEETIREQGELARKEADDVSNKVNSILSVVMAASSGDLTGSAGVEGDDDLAMLATGLDAFFDSLRKDLGVILSTSHELVQEAGLLEEVSEGMASAATDTSSAASTALDRAKLTEENSGIVSQGTSQLGVSISEIAQSSNTAATVASQGVELASRTVEDFRVLEEDSAKIGDVLTTINSIAEQTNLLALNATIEAARAGESGKGFAVVANEVKGLAQETADLTAEIATRITAIRTSTKNGSASIGEIFKLIEEIEKVQSEIAGAVEEQSAVTSEIGKEVVEIASAGAEIVKRLDGVSQGAEVTASGVQRTSITADKLGTMATNLQELVGRFKV